MATLRMRVFRFTGGDSDKVWAICREGSRVIVYYGKYTQERLGGGVVKPKSGNLDAEMNRRIDEQLNQGYRELGEFDVVDKKIVWTQTAQKPAPTFAPIAYATFARERTAVIREVLEGHFEVKELADALEISLPNGTSMTWPTKNAVSTMFAKEEHGAYGRLAVLAGATAINTVVFDTNNVERKASWLREQPELFSDIQNLRELAGALKLMAPPIRVKETAARPALW